MPRFSENSAIGPTEDDVALIWLDQALPGCDAATQVAILEADASQIGLGLSTGARHWAYTMMPMIHGRRISWSLPMSA